MSPSFLVHSFFLIISVVFSFFWANQPTLSLYTLQLIAILIILYFFLNWLQKKKYSLGVLSIPPPRWNIVLVNIIVLLLALSTGGLDSPLFFLVYFLLFGLSLVLGPLIVITLSCTLIVLFVLSSSLENINQLTTLISLILITPLSLFFGRQYLKALSQKGEIKILAKKYKKQKINLSQEETNTLLWLSLNFKSSMFKIIDALSQTLSTRGISEFQKQTLRQTLHDAKYLLKTGIILEEKIDKQTD